MSRYQLPAEVTHLIHARNQLRQRYSALGLRFTLDGNLVGDLGEAIAAELFDLRLVPRGIAAIDAYAPDNRTVQIKATGRGRVLAFTHFHPTAELLIGLVLHFEAEQVEVVYNGPYEDALSRLPADGWQGQKQVPIRRLRLLNEHIDERNRLVALQPEIGST
jgi:hypothetical protein